MRKDLTHAKASASGEQPEASLSAFLERLMFSISFQVIDITDDVRHGPANRIRMAPLEASQRLANAEHIDSGLAFKPAAFRSSRADRPNKALVGIQKPQGSSK